MRALPPHAEPMLGALLDQGLSPEAATIVACHRLGYRRRAADQLLGLARVLERVRPGTHGGRYVLVSVIKGPVTFKDPDFHRKEMALFGSRNATSEDFEQVIAAIRDRVVPIDRLITHRTSLTEAVHNIPLWATQKTGLIKALIEIGE